MLGRKDGALQTRPRAYMTFICPRLLLLGAEYSDEWDHEERTAISVAKAWYLLWDGELQRRMNVE